MLVGSQDSKRFIEAHEAWVEEAIRMKTPGKEVHWSESVAIGTKKFVDDLKKKSEYLAQSRKRRETETALELREPSFSYGIHFPAENDGLRRNNRYFWQENIVLPNSCPGLTP